MRRENNRCLGCKRISQSIRIFEGKMAAGEFGLGIMGEGPLTSFCHPDKRTLSHERGCENKKCSSRPKNTWDG